MRITPTVAACLAVFVLSLAALPSAAFELGDAERKGAVLADALDLGAQGDWDAAEARVASEQDPVLSDIVLWRKLRAGDGSIAEFRSYVSRRSNWPGEKQLRRAVFGPSAGGKGTALSGRAAKNWRQFDSLNRKRKYDQAEQFLGQVTGARENLGNPARWAERRRRLARRAAREGRARLSYKLASQHHLTQADGYSYADSEWISGWIALRKLNDAGTALIHFQRFTAAVETPISLARGGYWTGRALEALGRPDEARAQFAAAANYPTAFYGQLAATRVGQPADPSLAARDLPDWRTSPALRGDDVRMAVMLHYAGENRLAFAAFSQLGRTMQGAAAVGALGDLALELGQPHYAVRIGKHAARRGMLLYPAYYPLHALAGYASEIEPALAMAIARQETELNPTAISPAGARGLMQLMPATAKKVAGWIGEPYSKPRLTQDWQYNARLGQRYLKRRIDQFGGSYVLAAAAYNAGAGRVDQWIGRFGDPRLPGTDMIDWMESIPFDETRNYVQRVMEALYVYRSRLAGRTGPMTIAQDLARGVRG